MTEEIEPGLGVDMHIVYIICIYAHLQETRNSAKTFFSNNDYLQGVELFMIVLISLMEDVEISTWLAFIGLVL